MATERNRYNLPVQLMPSACPDLLPDKIDCHMSRQLGVFLQYSTTVRLPYRTVHYCFGSLDFSHNSTSLQYSYSTYLL